MNFSAIAKQCVGPGGAPYSRMHINEVINRRKRCSKMLADQLVSIGAVPSRRCLRVSDY